MSSKSQRHRDKSQSLFAEARRFFPGGVNSPVRAFGAVGGAPLFIGRGKGSHIWDADGNEYIDYVCSWGPLILGHAHPAVVAAVQQIAEAGISFGAPTQGEVDLARLITAAIPSIEMLRFVSSGTEATMSALRVARAHTGRSRIVKFSGCYHGHADPLLVKAGSGLATHGIPSSAGIPDAVASLTLVAEYNDLTSVERLFAACPREIAAVIVEPIAANMGVVLPKPGFLEGLRQLTHRHGALLIFDEVITGFRLAYGSVASMYRTVPDLICLGKVIGGGLPVGAYGGRREMMELVSPLGPVYQAGTLSGNPVAMAAGLATLKALAAAGTYETLSQRGLHLAQGLREAAKEAAMAVTVTQVGSLLTIFFTQEEVANWDGASKANAKAYAAFFHEMLDQGIYLPPSQFEAMFVSLAHTEEDLAATVRAARRAFAATRR